MKKIMYVFALVAFVFTSCDKNEVTIKKAETHSDISNNSSDPEMIKLGKKRENPYSLENVTKAYQTLQTDGVLRVPINIQATNLYVRFLPKSEEEYQTLKKQGYELFDYPLEYERIEGGSYYHDPSLPTNGFTWIYVVLPIDYIFGEIKYEIISELVLQSESEVSSISAQKLKGIDTNYWSQIEQKSFELTGNEYYSKKESTSGMMKAKVKPTGKITLDDEVLAKEIGIPGVKVRASRWFTAKYAYTDADGNYTFGYTFSGPVDYSIVWEREDWDIRNGVWAQATYNGPNTVTSSWSIKINKSDKQYVYANAHRACYTYWLNISSFGIKTPPKNSFFSPRVKIGVYDTAGRAYSSPLLRWATVPSICIYSYSENKDGSSTKNSSARLYQTTIHELAHTSHWEIDKSAFWDVDNKIVESWAVCVAYNVANATYPYSFSSWQYVSKTVIIDTYEKKYTPLMIDLMDNYNQYDSSLADEFVNDEVSGYTLKQIEGALKGAKKMDQLKDNLKTLYDNPTEDKLDELFTFYANI